MIYNKLVIVFLISFVLKLSNACGVANSTCSLAEPCNFGLYCSNTEDKCLEYPVCTQSADCPSGYNFMCLRNQCIPTINQLPGTDCYTDSNCLSNSCPVASKKCSQLCDKSNSICSWNEYCEADQLPSVTSGGTGRNPVPGEILYYCSQTLNPNISCTAEICGPSFRCYGTCKPIFSAGLDSPCPSKTSSIELETYCDISQNLICGNTTNSPNLKCIKYVDPTIGNSNSNVCQADSDCNGFEKCITKSSSGISVSKHCVPKYNINEKCANATKASYACGVANNSPLNSQSFYKNCSTESCNYIKECINQEYDSLSCHVDSFIACPSMYAKDDSSNSVSSSTSSSSPSSSSLSSSSDSNSNSSLSSSSDFNSSTDSNSSSNSNSTSSDLPNSTDSILSLNFIKFATVILTIYLFI